VTANKIYKQSGTTLPFNLWLGKMKSKHGGDFVKKFSMGNIESEIAPPPVVLNASGNVKQFEVLGVDIKKNASMIVIVGGLAFLGYCVYKMNKAKK
tara:strand:+ start:13746 stop:14033 length:288 start_codon:yes stop_codon:yes gene_type:complete